MEIKHGHADSGHRLTAGLEAAPEPSTPSPWKPAARSKAGEEMMPQAQQRHSLPDQWHALITKDREWGKNADNSLGPEEASGLPDELNL